MRKKGGFGLGLSLARKQAERLGGKLFAYNSSQGGLVMSLTLPIKLNHLVD
jgi:two-component system sensor histidine kinase PfeS